jgi:hypothetical protein
MRIFEMDHSHQTHRNMLGLFLSYLLVLSTFYLQVKACGACSCNVNVNVKTPAFTLRALHFLHTV